jgi:integrase/recombinase XerD
MDHKNCTGIGADDVTEAATSQGRGRRAMPRRKVMLLEEVLEVYYQDCRVQGYSPATITGYQRTLRRFLRWARQAGLQTVPELRGEAVKRYIAHVQQRPKWAENAYVPTQAERVSATTVRNYVRALKALGSWLEREGYTAENPLLRVRKPKADEVPLEPFTQAEFEAIFGAFDLTDAFQLRDFVILHTLWDTGMRVGELVSRRLEDVDLKTCEIRIAHAKWGKWRDIGFGKQTQKYLSRYATLCRPEPTLEGDTHLFLSVDGYPLAVGAVEHICQHLSKRIGIRAHPHRFRHTFAVGMLRNATDIRTLQKLMGHASIQILMRYLNLGDDEAIEAHRVNSPADKHHAMKQATARRSPMRQRRRVVA